MKKQSIYIKTWGCQMNAYDSQKCQEILENTGSYCAVAQAEEADILILNTCSIREKAHEKLFHQLGRWRSLKRANPDLIIAVGGCVASTEGKHILQRAPYVDIVFGPQTLQRMPQLLAQHRLERRPIVDVSFPVLEKFDALPRANRSSVTAYVSIMEGCNKFCSYCVVPYTRGREISRPLEAVLEEVKSLAAQGVREVTYLGQNVNAYAGLNREGKRIRLDHLIRLTAEIEGIIRIRFTTNHPMEFTPEMVAMYQEIPQLAGFLHLPVQSGSNRILAKMRRGYSVERYKELVAALRRARPNLLLSSDFIVGFPGETEEDFAATLDLVHELDLDICYSFLFSPRPGTPAAQLPDGTPLDVKQERLMRLQTRIQEQTNLHSVALLDNLVPVLFEEVEENPSGSYLKGRTEHFRTVLCSGGNISYVGTLEPVKITRAKGTVLEGELLSDPIDIALNDAS